MKTTKRLPRELTLRHLDAVLRQLKRFEQLYRKEYLSFPYLRLTLKFPRYEEVYFIPSGVVIAGHLVNYLNANRMVFSLTLAEYGHDHPLVYKDLGSLFTRLYSIIKTKRVLSLDARRQLALFQ